MTPKISLITAVVLGAALALAAPAFAGSGGAGQQQVAVHVSPDLGDPAAAARQAERFAMLDARERSMALKSSATTATTSDPVRDDYFRVDISSLPTPSATTGSSRNVAWPEIGIGFAIGALLAAGLILATRMPRVRQPAQ
jgi:hypothetical protein